MGTTTNGMRWPAPTDPVAQGALAIRNLAEDATARSAKLYRAAVTATSVPASGANTQVSDPITLTSVPYPVLAQITIILTLNGAPVSGQYGNMTISTFGGGAWNPLIAGRFGGIPQVAQRLIAWDLVPANTARPYCCFASGAGGIGFTFYNTAPLGEFLITTWPVATPAGL